MLHTVPLAGCLESVGCEAGAAVGEPVGDPEGQGVECVRAEGNGRGRGRVILDGEVHIAGGAVEGDGEGAFAGGAVAVAELGQVLHVDMHEADLVVLEGAVRLAGLPGRQQPVETLRLEDAIDGVPVQVRQEVADDEGQRVEGEAGGPAERAHDGALLIAGAPGQLMGSRRAILTGIRAAFAPLADGLRWKRRTLGRHAGVLVRAGDLGADSRGGAGLGMDGEHQLVGDEHLGLHVRRETVGPDQIMGLTAAEAEPDRVAERVDRRVDPGSQAAAGPSTGSG
ncbi:hypothetical protein HNR00_004838 [Methylorubrum rhodinum]|uniref:Uncharacterized protein n=1 Tax=Methylorubrum rhodinum TaxID=29428 RepID=A0A840ZST7_9HYPH|nr:hypothetical protein [Methylorubrum rhodinum]